VLIGSTVKKNNVSKIITAAVLSVLIIDMDETQSDRFRPVPAPLPVHG
jgi:hypothetical protein